MAIKSFTFLRRKPGLDPEEFHAYWRGVHARHLADTPSWRRHIRRYELNHRLPGDADRDRHALEVTDTGFDGVAVLWFDSEAERQALFDEPGFAKWVADDAPQFRAEQTLSVVTREPDVVVDKPGRGEAGAKMLCILRRNAALDPDVFHAHWLRNHGGLFQDIPELNGPLIGYDQNHGVDPLAAFDGVTEQWFHSLESFLSSLDAPAHRTEVEPDVAYLLDPASINFVMAGKPTVVIDG